ncbi:alpha/beta hydrolase [Bacillus sp. H-16]|uniref:alpha/beta hydrolase n=1 Tax=Alteribacter salitolerans TaxID=2912333 RepID=UPI0019655ECB|nr:alpha/beta hydrolase [Alteribacter salitolerans]MBM7094346.1 alpha/beta hydrolase [Alteribacter salitolerans]
MSWERDITWTELLPVDAMDLSQLNPQESHTPVMDYLQFYHYNLKTLAGYRCELVNTMRADVHVQLFTPENPKGTILLVHGYMDHTGGLSACVNAFLKESYEVAAIDLPGHGLSSGDRGAIRDFSHYVDAVKAGWEQLDKYRCAGPVYGLGHSTGGAVLFHGVSEGVLPLKALMMAGPLYHPYQWKWVRLLLPVASKWVTKKKRRFKQNSKDERYHLFLKHDPLQVRELPTSWLMALTEWQKDILACSKVEVPVYLLQGTKDTTVQWQENVEFFNDKCKDLQVALFEGAGHQLLNEKEAIRELAFERMSSFIHGRSAWQSTLEKEPENED